MRRHRVFSPTCLPDTGGTIHRDEASTTIWQAVMQLAEMIFFMGSMAFSLTGIKSDNQRNGKLRKIPTAKGVPELLFI